MSAKEALLCVKEFHFHNVRLSLYSHTGGKKDWFRSPTNKRCYITYVGKLDISVLLYRPKIEVFSVSL